MKKILLIVGVVALIAGALVGGIFLGRGSGSASEAAETHTTVEDEIAADAHGGGGGHGPGEKEYPVNPADADLFVNAGREPLADRTVEMESFVANLNDPTGRWFVKATIQLELNAVKNKQLVEENKPPLRDATLMLLSSKAKDDLQTPAGRERFKRELMVRFEGILPPETIRNIFITNFMVFRQ